MNSNSSNLIAFEELLSLEAVRSKYDKETGLSNLFILADFFTNARIGGEESSPVIFQLSIRRASVLIHKDKAEILDFEPSSTARSRNGYAYSKAKFSEEKSHSFQLKGEASGGLQDGLPQAFTTLGGQYEQNTVSKSEIEEEVWKGRVVFNRRKHGESYVWDVQPNLDFYKNEKCLKGEVWRSDEICLLLYDSKYREREHEPPEPSILIQCRREDLVISGEKFKNKKLPAWKSLGREKQMCVHQYLKEELLKEGLECDDLSNDYSKLTLARATPRERLDV